MTFNVSVQTYSSVNSSPFPQPVHRMLQFPSFSISLWTWRCPIPQGFSHKMPVLYPPPPYINTFLFLSITRHPLVSCSSRTFHSQTGKIPVPEGYKDSLGFYNLVFWENFSLGLWHVWMWNHSLMWAPSFGPETSRGLSCATNLLESKRWVSLGDCVASGVSKPGQAKTISHLAEVLARRGGGCFMVVHFGWRPWSRHKRQSLIDTVLSDPF